MSASLVGSEMCIRDRPPTRVGGARAAYDPRWLASKPHFTVALRRSATVSYTHLTLPTICSV
eukprot:10898601-Alexandrium_andersonii.AAC.1